METEMEMEMEAAEGMSWKALYQRRVVLADAHCRNADSLLHGLVVSFVGQEARDMVACGADEARRALEAAHAQLALAIANMGAARHLALRCGGGPRALVTDSDYGSDPSPSTPTLCSTSSVADPEARRVLPLLREASELVNRVHDLVEGARGHMGAAQFLLLALGLGEDDTDSAPWVHPPCIAEQLEGAMDLGEAFSQALDLVMLTKAAREAAFGVGDD
jgi:hypothetical protein